MTPFARSLVVLFLITVLGIPAFAAALAGLSPEQMLDLAN